MGWLVLTARPGAAFEASIGWEPSAQAAGYTLFVRYAGFADAEPIDVGLPPADPDGLLRVVIADLPLSPGIYFSVAGYDEAQTIGAVSRELSISYEQAAAVTDSDSDGLSDLQEDADPNGVVDPGETDPHDGDSDGDGFSDGSEVLIYGTDPLDAASVPECTGDCSPTATCATGCDDGNPCTLDLCELGSCLHLPATAQCDDGIACTSFDSCDDGVCAGSSICGAGSECTPTLNACTVDQVWIAAALDPDAERRGAMTSDAAYTGGADEDVYADSLAPELIFADSTTNTFSGGSGDEIHYAFTLTTTGQWYLWGRFYWPGTPGSNEANSFLARVDGGPRLRFGNNRDYFRRWHWDGDGSVESGVLMPLSLGELEAGAHTLVIEKREVTPIPPRLDVIVLSRHAEWSPSDEAARTALAAVLPVPIETTTTTTTLPAETTTTTWDPQLSTTTTTTFESTPETTTTTFEPTPETTTTTFESTPETTTTTLPPPPTTTTLPPECGKSADCDDADACTADSCVSGQCAHAPLDAGTCNDGDPCTIGDACSAGACSGWALDCSHLDGPCTYGVCDPQTSECAQADVASGTSCTDGSACTTGDMCDAGVCSGIESCAEGTYCDTATQTCKVRGAVWLSAARDVTASFAGSMTRSSEYADGDDADDAADSIEPLLVYVENNKNDWKGTSGDEVTYSIDLPAAGSWYLWGRLYYPGRPGSNDANSFFVRVDDGSAVVFGNNRNSFRRWHWGGGGAEHAEIPTTSLELGELSAGPHALTILKREVNPIAPRLDVLVLTQDPDWTPTDAEAVSGLAGLR